MQKRLVTNRGPTDLLWSKNVTSLTGGPTDLLGPKTWRHSRGGPTDLLGPKTWPSLTGGPDRPFRCLDRFGMKLRIMFIAPGGRYVLPVKVELVEYDRIEHLHVGQKSPVRCQLAAAWWAAKEREALLFLPIRERLVGRLLVFFFYFWGEFVEENCAWESMLGQSKKVVQNRINLGFLPSSEARFSCGKRWRW